MAIFSQTLKHEGTAQLIVFLDILFHPVLTILFIYPLATSNRREIDEVKFLICEGASIFVWILLTKSVYSTYKEVHFFNVRNQIDLWKSCIGAHTLFALYLTLLSRTLWVPFIFMCVYRIYCIEQMDLFRGEVDRETRKLLCLLGQRRYISDDQRMLPGEKLFYPQRIIYEKTPKN